MSREILFRGKRKDNGEWVEGDFCHPCNIVYLENGYDPVLGKDDSPCCNDDEVIPETVGQYTGLTDKNGKKIFEGDIVKYIEFYKFSEDEDLENAEEKIKSISVVKFVNGRFSHLPIRRNCEDYWYSYAEDDFEVIGNIHDNPELLEVQG